MKRDRKRKAVIWKKVTPPTISYSLREALLNAVISYTAMAFLVVSSIRMLGDVWPMIRVKNAGMFLVLSQLFILELFFELFLPELESRIKKKRKIYLIRAIVVISVGFITVWVSGRYLSNHMEEITEGALETFRNVLVNYNRYYMKNVSLGFGNEMYISVALTFFLMVGNMFLCLVTYLIRKKYAWLLFPGLVLLGEMYVGQTPAWNSELLFLCGAYLLSASGQMVGRIGRRKEIFEKGKKRAFVQNLVQSVLSFALLGLIVLLVSILGKAPSEKLMEKSDSMLAFQKQLEVSLLEKQFSVDVDLFSERKSISNEKPDYKEKEILVVTVDGRVSSDLYLKDFQGTNYENGSWKSDRSAFDHAWKKDAPISKEEMQKLLLGGVYDQLSSFSYHILYQNRNKNMFAPYFIDVTDDDIAHLESDALVLKTKSKKETEFRAGTINLLGRYQISSMSNRLVFNATAWDRYSEFVTMQYLEEASEVPTAGVIAGRMDNQAQWYSALDQNLYRYDMAYKVAEQLSSYTYSTELESIGYQTDAVEYFLSESHEGYCMHFASAGVLILRKLGIPARYASGYLLRASSFQKNGDGTYSASVLDSDAHAWVEIYLDRIGWIPVDVTPGSGLSDRHEQTELVRDESDKQESSKEESVESSEGNESAIEAETVASVGETESRDIQSENGNKTEETQKEETERGIDDEKEADGHEASWTVNGINITGREDSEEMTEPDEDEAGFLNGLRVVFVVLLIACGIFALIFGVKMLKKEMRIRQKKILEAELQKQHYRKCVNLMNRKMYRRISGRGRLRHICFNDKEYGEALKDTFRDSTDTEWEDYIRIVKEAAFSGEEIDKKKAMYCYRLFQKYML